MDNITSEEFEKVDLRSGTVVKAETFPKATPPHHIGCGLTLEQISGLNNPPHKVYIIRLLTR
jgi:tRNA-binding EMAP/Myf-like protein